MRKQRDAQKGGFKFQCRVKWNEAWRNHMRGKGYATNRRRDLGAQRERIVRELEALNGSQ